MTPGSAVCACPGAAVWVWLHVCLSICASEPMCVGLCDHCCSCRVCVELCVWGGLCVCVFLDAQLCGNLWSVWVAGALVSLQARWVSSSLLAPRPLMPSETVSTLQAQLQGPSTLLLWPPQRP